VETIVPSRLERPARFLEAPADIASLAVFRVGFGVLLACQAWSYLSTGRIERFYVLPVLHFTYPGFAWVRPLSAHHMTLLFWVLLIAGLMIAAGLLHRLAAAAYTLGYGYAFLLDTAAYNNHIYLILLLTGLFTALPVHRAVSLDSLLRPHLRAATVPRWMLWLVRFQIGIPYLFGGIAKLNADWMLRAQPMRVWFADGSEGPIHLDLLRETWVAYAMSWSGMLLDLLALPLLCWRRSRPWMMVALTLFHLANAGLFVIGVFPWLMIWATLLFLPEDWPRRLRLIRPQPRGGKPPEPGRRRLPLAAACGWVLVQMMVPLRHYLHPGNVDWTEESHRFSWRMKLRDKRGPLVVFARDPATGTSVPVPEVMQLLQPFQLAMLPHDPEMVRQLAVYLSDQLRKAGSPGVEIHVQSEVSFNARPPSPLIDPDVDLGHVGPHEPRRRWMATLDPSL
jgi:hypothetical protein